MLKSYGGNIIVVSVLLIALLACSLPGNNPTQQSGLENSAVQRFISVSNPVTYSANPELTELLDCAVTRNSPDNTDEWVKFADEYYWYLNIIERDAQGRMWLATDGHGLLMFDGLDWHNWQPEDQPEMSGDALRTMAVSGTNVYVGAYGSSDGGNLLVYDIKNDQWEAIAPGENAIRDNVIGGVAINRAGQVYAMTKAGLDVFDQGTWTYFDAPFEANFTMHIVDDAVFDLEENYWIASTEGIWKFDGETWTSYTQEQGQLPSNSVNALDIDREGRVWAATTSGLAVFSNGQWFVFSPDTFPWYQDWLSNVAIDSQNRVWVTSNTYLSVYNGTEAVLFTPTVMDEKIWDDAIGFDSDGCVWVGVALEMSVFRGKLDLKPGNYDFLK